MLPRSLALQPGILATCFGSVEQAFAPYGLRLGSLTKMVLISANPGHSQVELSRIGDIDNSAIVTIVDELEKLRVRCRWSCH